MHEARKLANEIQYDMKEFLEELKERSEMIVKISKQEVEECEHKLVECKSCKQPIVIVLGEE